ncbi:MAG: carbon-nitrogen hydrolase family protein [Peptostreptococcales bacterium]|jgi:predicted amidohydrolase
MDLTIAVVQTETYRGDNEKEINIKRAKEYIDEAADKGAKIICFPESFPGPWKQSAMYSPIEDIAQKAAERKVYVIIGALETFGEHNEKCYNLEVLIGPDGNVIGKYRRTSPHGPWMYTGGWLWDFNYVAGDDLPVFETEYCKIGILICSEVYVPELSRVLALKGAEIIFIPNGVARSDLWETWSTLIKARAFENLAVSTTCRNIIDGEEGLAIVAGPEGTLLESREAGVHIVNVDLERLRWLRENEDRFHHELPYKVKPGLLTQWRRPELYNEIVKKDE